MMIKNILFLFIALTTFTNVSYASFTITEKLDLNQDTLQTEEIKKYHDHLIDMGFDLNSC